MEVVADSLKRTNDIESKDAIIGAIKTTKMDTIGGPIDFTAPVQAGTLRPVPNVYKTPLGAAQWRKGTKWPYELFVVGNASAPMVTIQSEVQPLA